MEVSSVNVIVVLMLFVGAVSFFEGSFIIF